MNVRHARYFDKHCISIKKSIICFTVTAMVRLDPFALAPVRGFKGVRFKRGRAQVFDHDGRPFTDNSQVDSILDEIQLGLLSGCAAYGLADGLFKKPVSSQIVVEFEYIGHADPVDGKSIFCRWLGRDIIKEWYGLSDFPDLHRDVLESRHSVLELLVSRETYQNRTVTVQGLLNRGSQGLELMSESARTAYGLPLKVVDSNHPLNNPVLYSIGHEPIMEAEIGGILRIDSKRKPYLESVELLYLWKEIRLGKQERMVTMEGKSE
jgi:hypothetical protein